MEKAVLDLRFGGSELKIYVDRPLIDTITLANISNIQPAYTLTINGQTYTVGNGLAVTGNNITWAVDFGTFDAGITEGILKADTTVAAHYFECKIIVVR